MTSCKQFTGGRKGHLDHQKRLVKTYSPFMGNTTLLRAKDKSAKHIYSSPLSRYKISIDNVLTIGPLNVLL